MKLEKCNTVGEMISEVKKFYDTDNTPVGPITRKMLIVGLKNAIHISPPLDRTLNDCHTFGMMLNAIQIEYSFTAFPVKDKSKIIAGFNSALVMTRCKKR
jgi:hypothetical protein